MSTIMQLYDRSVRVELSKAAARACAQRTTPLLVEMELRFGCLVIKRATFRELPNDAAGIQIAPHLYLDFRATAMGACTSGRNGGDSFPTKSLIANIRPYVPSWCHIDYARGRWSCEFGYDRSRSELD